MSLLAAMLVAVIAPVVACGSDGDFERNPRLTAAMRSATGDPIGTVVMDEGPTGYPITVMLEGLVPGPHGIHIHAVGTCNPDFKASGGHINLDNKQQWIAQPRRPDNGDLPNVYAGVDGTVRAELFATRVNVLTIMEEDSSAIVVQENRDDHATQPIGGAGGALPAEC